LVENNYKKAPATGIPERAFFELGRHVDQAMRKGKDAGRNNYAAYSPFHVFQDH